jgi:hypothetical protein
MSVASSNRWSIRGGLWLLALAVLLGACKKGPSATKRDNPKERAAAKGKPDITAKGKPDTAKKPHWFKPSGFLTQVKAGAFKDTSKPAAAPVYRWDFTAKKVHHYSYQQTVRISDAGTKKERTRMSVAGALLIKSQGDGTAEFVLKDVVMKMKMGGAARELKQPPMVVQGMKEDGSGLFGNDPKSMMLKLMMPLPPTGSLELGRTIDIPMTMPFNAMGSQLPVKGRNRIKLNRFVQIGKRTCAEFAVDTNISELKIPADLKGTYRCAMLGKGILYFDVESRTFVSATIAVALEFRIDATGPDDKPGQGRKMSMRSDNLIRVSLK